MKIVMATANHDERMLALLEFKKLNVAHSIDFVASSEELMSYILSRAESASELPNLLLLDLTMDHDIGSNSISMIKSNSKLKQLDIILFATYSSMKSKNNEEASGKESSLRTPIDSLELNWILKEICETLATKQGWHYHITPAKNKKEIGMAPAA